MCCVSALGLFHHSHQFLLLFFFFIFSVSEKVKNLDASKPEAKTPIEAAQSIEEDTCSNRESASSEECKVMKSVKDGNVPSMTARYG